MPQPISHVNASKRGLDLIKRTEGLDAIANLCSAVMPAIGHGNTGRDVTQAWGWEKIVSEAEAKLLRQDIKGAEKAGSCLVMVLLTQNQFDALCSITYGADSIWQRVHF